MFYGQGASMALPIWAIYMNKVFGDESLGYSQEERFVFPDNFDPCGTNQYHDSDTLRVTTPTSQSRSGLDELFD